MCVEVLIAVAVGLFVLYCWDLVVSLAGFLPLRHPQSAEGPERRFACIVCAHNEQRVIAGVVRALREQDYPPDLVRVFVVADNCTDDTAAAATSAGAEVLVRHDETKRTKGYALQWGMDQLLAHVDFDGLCVFDADNDVDRNFLRVMNGHLGSGSRAIQCFLDTKNPEDSWVTRCIALAYHVTNRFWMRSRERLGLPATLGGTGFCLERGIVQEYRWDPGSLSEDLELAVKLTLDGIRVHFTPLTRIYDEKPPGLYASMRQRMRWMQGHNDVAFRWVSRCLWHAARAPSIGALDVGLYLLQPLRLLTAFLVMVALLVALALDPSNPSVARAFSFSIPAVVLWGAVFLGYPLLVATAEGVGWFALKTLVPYVFFSFTWVPAVFLGLLRMRSRVWLHTKHVGEKVSGAPKGQPQGAASDRDHRGERGD